ncbi:MAG: hypothetical protein KTR31_23640 [Myxococcales bacterium]|nr:hypothetical protein [Myxococcales bacterium]
MVAWMVAGMAMAQQPVLDPGLPSERRHMAILGAWSGLNLVGGTVGLVLSDTPKGRSFHGTNLAWNTVNAGIALAGGLGAHARRDRLSTPEELRKRHRGLRTALAVNMGLDVVYVGTGLALWALGGRANGLELRSVGQALVIQGGFLMAFDTAFLVSHRARTGEVTVGPVGVSLRF